MFPEVGQQFLEQRQNNTLVAESLYPNAHTTAKTSLSEFDMSFHGEHYHVKVAGFGSPGLGQQSCFLWVDGVPEEVVIQHSKLTAPQEVVKKNYS